MARLIVKSTAMQHHTGTIETLTDAERAGRNLMGECACGHMRGFSPFTLRCELRRDMRIADVGKVMRCRRCGRRGLVRLVHNRNVVEVMMARLRVYPEFRAMCAPRPLDLHQADMPPIAPSVADQAQFLATHDRLPF